jgi:hypothetical protein
MPFEKRPPYRRPQTSEPKRNQIHLYVTAEEWTIIDKTSEDQGLSKSDFVRMCIRNYLQRQAE